MKESCSRREFELLAIIGSNIDYRRDSRKRRRDERLKRITTRAH